MTRDVLKPDGRVWIPISALPSIALRHIVSGLDPTIAVVKGTARPTLAGYTEWVGTWNSTTITVGWDWGLVGGDGIVVLNPNEIRSNVCIVSEDHHPVPESVSKVHMLQWIELVPWRDSPIRDLVDKAKPSKSSTSSKR